MHDPLAGSNANLEDSGLSAGSSSMPRIWPKISLVTPVWNSVRYLEATIRSVLSQAYPNLEYIIVDGGSTDGSVSIICKYESQLNSWVSEPDRGMYDAINKGFARSSGELMGWISATDMLHAGSLFVIGSVFQTFPDVEWITGRPTGFNDEGQAVEFLKLRSWSRMAFLAGANRYIQQESTFWRRSLWERAGGRVDDSRRNASDFELWVRFFRYAKLYSVDALIGGFRSHPDSIGLQNLAECHRIHDEIIEQEIASLPASARLKAFRRISSRILSVPGLEKPWRKLLMAALPKLLRGSDTPIIRYRKDRWVME
jgi:glycosyltransferase involved in cell wall biosynthesis